MPFINRISHGFITEQNRPPGDTVSLRPGRRLHCRASPVIEQRRHPSMSARRLAVIGVALVAVAAAVSTPVRAHASTTSGPTSGPIPAEIVRPGGAAAADDSVDPPAHWYRAGAILHGDTDGAYGSFPVYKPVLADTDSHTLAELAVTSQRAIDRRDTVEVGWTVDRRLNGDDSPHLFVFHWVAGKGLGYNGQGFIPQSGAAEKPGDLLVPGSVHKFMIKNFEGSWWIGDNNTWFGRYPESLWPHLDAEGRVDGSTFTEANEVQWFGEVATLSTHPPCSQMGNGRSSSDVAGAARIDDIGEYNGPVVQVFPVWDNNVYSAAERDSDGIVYGGPGACGVARLVAVPRLIGLSPEQARSAILQSGGLKVGTATPVQQLDCTGQVISQSRAGGSAAPVGSLVDFEYSIAFPGQACTGPPVSQ